jgi:CheY-like chemotaxis protein
MDEQTLARAVEPFFTTKGGGKGTGLGVSMVHGLTSQLGGATTIESGVGLGTTINLWLPQSDAAPIAVTGTERGITVVGSGTALVVDDEELVRLSTADMLSDLGYSVVEAASGEEALRLIDAGMPLDLLVTDHLMPGMIGTDLAEAVISERPNVRVLIVSGYADSAGLRSNHLRLSKPFRKDELAASLSKLFAADTALAERRSNPVAGLPGIETRMSPEPLP